MGRGSKPTQAVGFDPLPYVFDMVRDFIVSSAGKRGYCCGAAHCSRRLCDVLPPNNKKAPMKGPGCNDYRRGCYLKLIFHALHRPGHPVIMSTIP